MDKGRWMLIIGIAFVLMTAFFCWCYTKKSARAEKTGWLVVGLLATAFAVFSVWYHIPIICRDHVQVVEMEGQKDCVVEVELIIQRSYLHGTEISGWICTPLDVYGTYSVHEASRNHGRYFCGSFFRADTLTNNLNFAYCLLSVDVGFSRGFSDVTYLDVIEMRESGTEYWYRTPTKP